jgi:hypothetical protein
LHAFYVFYFYYRHDKFNISHSFSELSFFSAMFDSIPMLSLADEAETEVVSSRSSERHAAADKNTAYAQKVERLEKDMLTLGRRLEQETQARRKLQEILLQAGLSLPGDVAFPD